MGKFIAGLFVALICGVAVLIAVGLNNINVLVKDGVEIAGSKALSVPVSLGTADIKVIKGRGELQGLTINNPVGFNSSHLFHVDKIALQLEPRSLIDSVIVINEISIDGASLIVEQKDLLNSNVQVITEKLKAHQKGSDSSKTENETPPTEMRDVRFVVDKFSVQNTRLSLLTKEWGDKELKLLDIHASDLGDRSVGLTPDELTKLLLNKILKQAQRQIEKELKRKAREKLKEKLKEEVQDKLKEKIKEEVKEKLGEEIEDQAIDEIEDKLKDALNENLSEKDKEQLNQLRSLFGR